MVDTVRRTRAGDGVACTPLSDNLSAWREAVAASRRNHDEISDEALGALTRAVDAAGRRAMATPSASALEVLAKLEILDVQIRESAETGVRRDDELIAGLDAIAADADRLGLRGAADPDAEITAAVAAWRRAVARHEAAEAAFDRLVLANAVAPPDVLRYRASDRDLFVPGDPFDGPFYDLSFTPWFADRAAAIRARRERTDFEARVLSRYDEIAAALAAWTLADEAALDAAGLPAIEAVERRAYRRRHSTFGRLLAMAAKTPVGVAQKLAAVAEQIDLDDADEPRTTPQAIEALFRSAARDALRIVPLA